MDYRPTALREAAQDTERELVAVERHMAVHEASLRHFRAVGLPSHAECHERDLWQLQPERTRLQRVLTILQEAIDDADPA